MNTDLPYGGIVGRFFEENRPTVPGADMPNIPGQGQTGRPSFPSGLEHGHGPAGMPEFFPSETKPLGQPTGDGPPGMPGDDSESAQIHMLDYANNPPPSQQPPQEGPPPELKELPISMASGDGD